MEWMIGKDWKFCKLKSEKEKERYESVDANATSKTDSVGKKMSRILETNFLQSLPPRKTGD